MLLVTVKAFAEKCGLPVRTIRRLCQEGQLPALQIGRTYYLDAEAAEGTIGDIVQKSTAGKKMTPAKPEGRPRLKQFDFLKALSEA